jgi:DNA-binding XRE family transcriptional regulator
MPVTMPRESTLKLAPLPRGKESLGQRLARFRKERGYTQTELAAKIGLIQALVSDYERDKLRMNSMNCCLKKMNADPKKILNFSSRPFHASTPKRRT